jgi:MFS family permease
MNVNNHVFKRAARTSTILFFFFMLLHQTDKLLIGPLQTPIMDTFHMTYTQWGAINTGALVVGALLYPVWGWLNDRYNRARLLALASLIWGSTTWLSAIVRTFPAFLVTRSSTGIDDSSYPGMYSLLADYYPPKSRGRIYGLLQLAQPLGYLLGMVLALLLGGVIGWRSVFYITGSMGIVLAVAIFFGVKDVPRGSGEEELKGVELTKFKFSWKTAREIFKKRSLILVMLQGFTGVFPWNVITYYFFGYLASERGYDSNTQLMIMAPAVLVMALGYPLGGVLGDQLFKRTKRGRLIVSATGILLGMILLTITMNVPTAQVTLFTILLLATALFMPFSSPNILSTIYDVTLPEVRSTTNSIQYFIESIGSATAPLIAGIIADATSVGNAILWISLSAWALCFLFILGAIILIPHDIEAMHRQLEERAAAEKEG